MVYANNNFIVHSVLSVPDKNWNRSILFWRNFGKNLAAYFFEPPCACTIRFKSNSTCKRITSFSASRATRGRWTEHIEYFEITLPVHLLRRDTMLISVFSLLVIFFVNSLFWIRANHVWEWDYTYQALRVVSRRTHYTVPPGTQLCSSNTEHRTTKLITLDSGLNYFADR